jgi:hypothetical protein
LQIFKKHVASILVDLTHGKVATKVYSFTKFGKAKTTTVLAFRDRMDHIKEEMWQVLELTTQ